MNVIEKIKHYSKENEKPVIDDFKAIDYSKKVALVVEDNELNLEIISEILSMTGIKVESATDGEMATKLFKASEEDYYNIIFMDIQMPNMNGYEATKRIRALDRKDAEKVPIIAMTANAFSDDVKRAVYVGMNEHLAKPIDFKKLQMILEAWL